MRRLIGLTLILLLIFVPLAQAQEDVFELPAIADGDVISDSFEDDVTANLYAFYGSDGDSVTITMTQNSADLDPFLVLMDSEGAVLAYDDDSGETDFSAAIDNVNLENDGVYFVIASSFYFVDGSESSTDSELSYDLSISGQNTPDNVDDADTISLEVDVLSIGDSIDGESDEDAPVAIFFLDASAGDSATISLEDADFLTLLHVFNPDGNRIAVDASLADIDFDDDGLYIIMATDNFFYEAVDDGGFFEGGSFVLVIE